MKMAYPHISFRKLDFDTEINSMNEHALPIKLSDIILDIQENYIEK